MISLGLAALAGLLVVDPPRMYLPASETGGSELQFDPASPGTKIPMVVGPDSARVSSDGKLFAPAGLPTEPAR